MTLLYDYHYCRDLDLVLAKRINGVEQKWLGDWCLPQPLCVFDEWGLSPIMALKHRTKNEDDINIS
jgi:hypothetical protein